MDAERRPQEPRPPGRRLRDISHLYISAPRRGAALGPGPGPAPRRRLRVALAGPGPAAARSAVGANLAVQFARQGRRTLVVDLDPALPGIGFRLGLRAADSLAHVPPGDGPRLARGFLGIRVLCGIAGHEGPPGGAAALAAGLGDMDCVLLQVPAEPASGLLRDLGALWPAQAGASTLSRAAAHSPMIGAWLATAQRPAPEPDRRVLPVDVVLWVVEGSQAVASPPAALQQAAEVEPRFVLLGDAADGTGTNAFWARVPAVPGGGWLPVSLLEPEHPAARAFEGLAQAVLAASARPGGGPHA